MNRAKYRPTHCIQGPGRNATRDKVLKTELGRGNSDLVCRRIRLLFLSRFGVISS